MHGAVTAARLSVAQYEPALHAAHEPWPELDWNSPTAHELQELAEPPENQPEGQPEQANSPAAANFPEEQGPVASESPSVSQ